MKYHHSSKRSEERYAGTVSFNKHQKKKIKEQWGKMIKLKQNLDGVWIVAIPYNNFFIIFPLDGQKYQIRSLYPVTDEYLKLIELRMQEKINGIQNKIDKAENYIKGLKGNIRGFYNRLEATKKFQDKDLEWLEKVDAS